MDISDIDRMSWTPETFIAHLAAGWQLAEPEAFIRHFRPLVHPDVVSRQPLRRPQTGIAVFEQQFRDLFRLLPGATATIKSWACAEPNIYVEFELHAPGGRRPLDMGTCDRFTLSGGLITERVVYSDPAPLLGFLARHPGRWPRLLSAR
jgi:ketosteroid isomerase-like protein